MNVQQMRDTAPVDVVSLVVAVAFLTDVIGRYDV
jgi:hypothetical protein